MVPSKKDKDHHLVRFLDIFRKLEINVTKNGARSSPAVSLLKEEVP